MRAKIDASEASEPAALASPERKLDTFDGLQAPESPGDHARTFDDIAAREPGEKGLHTFDDLTGQPSEGMSRGEAKPDSPEILEKQRLTAVSDEIRGHAWMQGEKWRTLSTDEKRIALEHSGRALSRAYRTPDPPLTTNREAPELLGEYGDGYSYDPRKERLTGSDYGISMNEDGVSERDRRLFGDDPREALKTYSHEFRHAYQSEQAHAYEKNFQVDDPVRAREWSENLKDENYINPPDANLAKSEPERYFREYEAYHNQPVERDAREFSDRVVTEVYSPKRHEDYEG